jgi:hypothetical protein
MAFSAVHKRVRQQIGVMGLFREEQRASKGVQLGDF